MTSFDLDLLKYEVPENWYENVYHDKKECCSAARSFTVLHEEKPKECWLFIHGYRGYPGELVRPALDLYELGYDIYVPRLPGHGTCHEDFEKTHGKDWMTLSKNALEDLKGKYEKVHLLGHSMGTSICAILGCADEKAGKIVYACLSFENKEMPLPARLVLRFLSLFTPKVHCKWHASSKYHQHYENAPCDELYLGNEYWQYYFTKQLIDYYKIMKDGLKTVSETFHEHLVIFPSKDHIITEPSVELMKKAIGDKANVVKIENGTHSIFYDKDIEAEEKAVQAILDFAK